MHVRARTGRSASASAPSRSRRPKGSRLALPWIAGALTVLAGTGRATEGAGASPGPGLLWPTDAGRCVTSAFCEFRSGHFHAGIDISTNGRTGYRALAVDDGEVVRVRSGCKGYGKAVYLRLRDGRTAVYAHLSAFAGAVEDTARAIAARTGSAYFDREFPPGLFPFRRGDAVAFTGETGIGVPHLHLEIRDARERPVDPLRAGLTVPDRQPPRVRRVALTPLAAGSSVRGGAETVRLDAPPKDAGPVPVEGDIALAAEISETKDGCRYDLAPAAVGMREGGRTLSEVRFDAFSFDETGLLDFQIDPRWSYASRGRFQNLARRPGYDLPFAGVDEERGILRGGADGRETVRRVELFARDSAGNEGSRTIELSFAPPPSLLSLSLARVAAADSGAPDSGRVEGRVSADGRGVRRVELQQSTDAGATWQDAGSAIPDADGTLGVRLAAPDPAASWIVRARAVDRLEVGGIPLVATSGPVPPPLPLPDVEAPATRGSFWDVRLPASGAAVAVRPDSARPGVSVRGDGWDLRVSLPSDPADATGGPRRIGEIVDAWGRARPWHVTPPFGAAPGRSAVLAVPDARAEVTFLPETVREPTAVRARALGRPAHAGEELVPLGALIRVETGAVPLAGDFEIRLEPDRAPGNPGRVAAFVQDGSSFRYIGGRKDPAREAWTVRARTAMPVGLFEDRTAPRVGAPSLSLQGGRVRVRLAATDRGAGLDCDGVEILLDGRPVPQEMDTERGEVVGWPDLPAVPGAGGEFQVRVVDRCGNSAQWRGTLRLP